MKVEFYFYKPLNIESVKAVMPSYVKSDNLLQDEYASVDVVLDEDKNIISLVADCGKAVELIHIIAVTFDNPFITDLDAKDFNELYDKDEETLLHFFTTKAMNYGFEYHDNTLNPNLLFFRN